jgi:pimeloyl-ACP methyl ester carboxylesterase
MELVRKYIDLNNGTVSYLEGGASLGPRGPLLFLHGFYLSAQAYHNSLLKLATQYRVIAPDLPGFGLTEYKVQKSPTYSDYTDMVIEFLAALGVSQKVELVGHSMGGGISIHFSATNPSLVDNLVLIDSGGLPLNITSGMIFRKFWEFFIIQGINTNFSVEYRDMIRSAFSNFFRFEFGTSYEILKMSLFEDLSQLISEINTPTLIVWGRNDLSIPLSYGIRLSQMISSSKLSVFDSFYHDWSALYPDKLLMILSEYSTADSRQRNATDLSPKNTPLRVGI